jgi:hypothetical protein
MNQVAKHLQDLKTFQIPEVDRINKIYFLEVEEKPYVKVGDSIRDVEERNRETMTNAALHRKQGTKPFYVVAQKFDGTTFRDKQFHTFLRKQGYTFELNDQGNESEWVQSDAKGNIPTVDQLLEELSKFISKPVYKSVELRPAQHYLLGKLQEAIDSGSQYVNAGFCVRVGKTIISLTHAANNAWMPVYIGKNLTSQSSAETDNSEFGIVPEMLTQSLHGVDELDENEASKKAKQIIANIDTANTSNRQIVFFVDEVDDASHTKKSRDIITPVVEHYKANGQFATIVTMSGTRIYRGEKILKDLTDGAIKELSLEYYEMQILQPETTCNRNYRHISFYSENADGLSNISDAMKNKEIGHKSLATVIVKLLGTNNFDIVTNDNFPHWFMKFATVGKTNANAFVRYLNRNCTEIEGNQYVFAAINGDVTTAKEAQDYCKKIIADNAGKVCVFISQGMATTSFSVTGIGNSVVFTDNELTADDTQALHRSATWAEGKTDCNMVVVTTNNSMEHSFDDIFEDETKLANTREEKIEIYKELLNNNSMVHYTVDGNSVRPVRVTHGNADKVIDQKQKSMTKISSLMLVVNELDEEIKEKILFNDHGYKKFSPTSEFSISATGNTFDPFGETEKQTTKKQQDPDKVSNKEKEKIMRAFVEMAVMVPAVAREQGVTIEEFDFWEELNISKELFDEVYNNSWIFRDRIDAIYSLCEDETHLVNNYISKLVA